MNPAVLLGELVVGSGSLAVFACLAQLVSLHRRGRRPVCPACGYLTSGRTGERCPECGLNSIGASARLRRAKLRWVMACTIMGVSTLSVGDITIFHYLRWRRILPNTALLLLRRCELPGLQADEELNERVSRGFRCLGWSDESALWPWQWRLARATKAALRGCDGPLMFDQVADALGSRKSPLVPVDLPLLRGEAVTLAELERLQDNLGVVRMPSWSAPELTEDPGALPLVTPRVHQVAFDGTGGQDLVLVLEVPQSWWKQVWILTPSAPMRDTNVAGQSSDGSYRLIQSLWIQLSPDGPGPDIIDLGQGHVLLGFETDACRGTGVLFKGRMMCALPPRTHDDCWVLPSSGYCCAPSGRLTELGEVDWTVGSSGGAITFTANLDYSIGYVGDDPAPEPEEPSSGYTLHVVIERCCGQQAFIRRELSGRLTPEGPSPFAPGRCVPPEIGDLWEPRAEHGR